MEGNTPTGAPPWAMMLAMLGKSVSEASGNQAGATIGDAAWQLGATKNYQKAQHDMADQQKEQSEAMAKLLGDANSAGATNFKATLQGGGILNWTRGGQQRGQQREQQDLQNQQQMLTPPGFRQASASSSLLPASQTASQAPATNLGSEYLKSLNFSPSSSIAPGHLLGLTPDLLDQATRMTQAIGAGARDDVMNLDKFRQASEDRQWDRMVQNWTKGLEERRYGLSERQHDLSMQNYGLSREKFDWDRSQPTAQMKLWEDYEESGGRLPYHDFVMANRDYEMHISEARRRDEEPMTYDDWMVMKQTQFSAREEAQQKSIKDLLDGDKVAKRRKEAIDAYNNATDPYMINIKNRIVEQMAREHKVDGDQILRNSSHRNELQQRSIETYQMQELIERVRRVDEDAKIEVDKGHIYATYSDKYGNPTRIKLGKIPSGVYVSSIEKYIGEN